MSQRLLTTLAVFALASGCAAHEDPDSATPKPQVVEPDPEPEPEQAPPPKLKLAEASISSVQLNENCPDPPAAKPVKSPLPSASSVAPAADESRLESRAQGVSARRSRRAPGSGPIKQPCTQSTVQMGFLGQGPEPAKVVVKEIRLMDSESKKSLGTIEARGPTRWVEAGMYDTWDETLPADSDLKASYKLGDPDWSEVEKKLGGGSYGPMFVLEVDVEIAGELQTVRSPEFPRERPHRIVT